MFDKISKPVVFEFFRIFMLIESGADGYLEWIAVVDPNDEKEKNYCAKQPSNIR